MPSVPRTVTRAGDRSGAHRVSPAATRIPAAASSTTTADVSSASMGCARCRSTRTSVTSSTGPRAGQQQRGGDGVRERVGDHAVHHLDAVQRAPAGPPGARVVPGGAHPGADGADPGDLPELAGRDDPRDLVDRPGPERLEPDLAQPAGLLDHGQQLGVLGQRRGGRLLQEHVAARPAARRTRAARWVWMGVEMTTTSGRGLREERVEVREPGHVALDGTRVDEGRERGQAAFLQVARPCGRARRRGRARRPRRSIGRSVAGSSVRRRCVRHPHACAASAAASSAPSARSTTTAASPTSSRPPSGTSTTRSHASAGPAPTYSATRANHGRSVRGVLDQQDGRRRALAALHEREPRRQAAVHGLLADEPVAEHGGDVRRRQPPEDAAVPGARPAVGAGALDPQRSVGGVQHARPAQRPAATVRQGRRVQPAVLGQQRPVALVEPRDLVDERRAVVGQPRALADLPAVVGQQRRALVAQERATAPVAGAVDHGHRHGHAVVVAVVDRAGLGEGGARRRVHRVQVRARGVHAGHAGRPARTGRAGPSRPSRRRRRTAARCPGRRPRRPRRAPAPPDPTGSDAVAPAEPRGRGHRSGAGPDREHGLRSAGASGRASSPPTSERRCAQACRPSSACGTVAVVSEGVANRASSMSSKPVIDTSPGTATPSSLRRASRPNATRSL